jgi:hypothetical protein
MSLLLSLIFRNVCRTTHERLAVDALRHLRCADAERWSDLFLSHWQEYLAGSEAPDGRFKDFQNHVLHVEEGNWGGAIQEARRWYGRVVDALRRREWSEAVFAAGALGHYFADPFMPLNTARTDEDTKVRQPLEWSIRRSYGHMQQIIEHDHGGYPQLETTRGDDWLERMILTGAELAHPHYQPLIQHYDLERALINPLSGMDQDCRDRIAQCLGHAVIGVARVLERAIEEAEVEPPQVETTIQGFFVALSSPFRRVAHYAIGLNERMAIEAIHDEALRSGKVTKNLAEEHREIRRLHAEQVLHKSLFELDQQPPSMTGTLHGSGAAERHHSHRLIAGVPARTQVDISTAWREAQRRIQEKRRLERSPSYRRAA